MVAQKKVTPAQLAKLEEAKRKEAELVQKAYDQQRLVRKEHGVRMVVLRERVKMIDTLYKMIAKKIVQDDKNKSWLRYVDCVNKPFGDRPAQLREYLAKWDCEIEEKVKVYFDWQMNINERTLLDQSPFRVDMTEQRLRTYQPEVAPPFRDKIEDALKVLDEVNDMLLNQHKFSSIRMEEVKVVRGNFQQHIWKFLDYLTHIITGNIDREMEILSPTDAQFNYKSDVFSVGIYTNRDVPLQGMQHDSDKLMIELDAVHMQLLCPHSLTFDGSSMRVFWFAYDHYSDYAPSYLIATEDSQYTQRNLLQSNRREWDKRENMEQTELNRMREARADYENELRIANDPALKAQRDAEAKAANAGKGKEKSKGKGKSSKKKGKEKKPMEPPIVTELTTVDMTAEYLASEEATHQKRMQKLNPDVGLVLKPSELNQRKFRVVGGTFAIHYLQRPKQFKQFVNHIFQRTYELPDIIKYNTYHAPFVPFHFDSTSSWTDAQKDQIIKQDNVMADKMLQITVRLPANVCWWDEPQIVRWEPWEESPEFLALSQELQHFHLNFDQIQLDKSMRLFNRLIKRSNFGGHADAIEDFNLTQRTEDIRLFYILTKFIIPKLSLNYRFECELREEEEKLEQELKRREHLKLEHEEDMRMMKEAKELRQAAREAKKLKVQLSSDQLEVKGKAEGKAEEEVEVEVEMEGEEELEGEVEEEKGSKHTLHSNKTEDADSDFSDEGPETLVEFVEMKSIVQGTAARELFPKQDTSQPINLEPSVHRPTSDSVMLSQLIQSIELFNRNELPLFKDNSKIDEIPDTVDPLNPETERKSSILDMKKDRKKSMYSSFSVESNLTPLPVPAKEKKGLHLVEHSKGKWVSEGIYVQDYDAEQKVITFKTTRIGIFGFAQNQYVNFPFLNWELLPNYEEVPMSVLFKITALHISFECLITSEGFKLTILRPKPALCPVKVPTDVLTLKQLIKFLQDSNMNIFPNKDALWYISDDLRPDETVFSYKHEPMVNHSYQAMAQFCQTHQFKRSAWNHLSIRRQAIIQSRQIVEGRQPEPFVEVQITPTDAYFVRVEEKCTELTIVELVVQKEPIEQEFSCDLFELLSTQSIDKSKKRQANTNVELRWQVAELLKAVQPLSYS